MRGQLLFVEKFFAAALYLPFVFPNLVWMAWMPLIWLVILNLRKIYVKDFIKYHCYQALLFNMMIFALPGILRLLINLATNLLSFIPQTQMLIQYINFGLSKTLLLYNLLLILVIIYALVWTLRGKFTYLPPISQAVNLLLR